jgi:hypothetical protein
LKGEGLACVLHVGHSRFKKMMQAHVLHLVLAVISAWRAKGAYSLYGIYALYGIYTIYAIYDIEHLNCICLPACCPFDVFFSLLSKLSIALDNTRFFLDNTVFFQLLVFQNVTPIRRLMISLLRDHVLL